MDTAQRIAQFENMVRDEADPNNDMAWFMLGGAYGQAGRHADAARAYMRCVQINPAMSKAFQLAGQAFISAGDQVSAEEVLTQGYKSAAERGDRMPMKAMGDLLTKLGKPLPKVAGADKGPESAPPPGVGGFVCKRTGRPGTKMSRPPFKGPIGAWIGQNISKETFETWIAQGTKVINELRLDLSRDEDEAAYDTHMREFLGIDDDLYEELTGARPVKP